MLVVESVIAAVESDEGETGIPEPNVCVMRLAPVSLASCNKRTPFSRVIVSVAKMMCLTGSYGCAGRPRKKKKRRRAFGKTSGGSQLAKRLMMRSKRSLKASKSSVGLAFRVNKVPKRAKSERVVLRMLSR